MYIWSIEAKKVALFLGRHGNRVLLIELVLYHKKRNAFLNFSISSSISSSLALTKTKNLKYLSSALPPAAAVGTMGTTDPNMGVGYEVAGVRLFVAGKLFAYFDFRKVENVFLEPRSHHGLATVSPRSRDTY